MNPQCIICQIHIKPTDNVYSTYCGHVFHYHCLSNWLGRSPTCPQCRQQTNNQQIIRLWMNDGGLNSSFTDEIDELKKELGTKLSEIEKKSREIKKLEDDIKRYKDNIDDLKDIVESQQTSYKKRLIELKSQLEEDKSKITNLEYNLKSQRDSYEEKVRSWQSKYDRYRYEHESGNTYYFY